MTKLHSPRGWLGYFVGCESEAIYHIYSPEKHKVYRIGVARVEDGEGLDDPHDAPCLEDRVPTPDIEISDRLSSEDEEGMSDDEDLYDFPGEIHAEHGRQQAREPNTEIAHQSEVEDDTKGEDESNTDRAEPEIISKYFDQSRHAGMAKRKNIDDTMLAPKRSRQATYDQRGIEQNDSSSDSSGEDDDS